MKQLFFLFLCLNLIFTSFTSCVKENKFPHQPIIEFKKFVLYENDSADCFINFKDGDGDIGIFDGDKISPDDLKMKYLYKEPGGTFLPVDSSFGTSKFDTLFYGYRVPNITPEGQYKGLDGEIKIKFRTAPLFGPHAIIKFEITLKDRAGNTSNMVTTNEITVIP